jgi:hypothetical protein
MATFDINAYLNSKLGGSPSEGKIDAILRAKEEKLDGLRKFRDAMALEDPVRLQREQAIRDGRTAEERVQDIGLSLVQGLDGMAKLPAMLYDKTGYQCHV